MKDFESVSLKHSNTLRVIAIKNIRIYCDKTDADFFDVKADCLGNLSDSNLLKDISTSRFKFYLKFAMNAKKLNKSTY